MSFLLLLVTIHSTSMRIISGTLRPTPLPWLPVLCNIPPPHLRRQEATARLLAKVQLNDSLPLNTDIALHPTVRLPSRRPVWLNSPVVMTANSAWSSEWSATDVVNHSLVSVPSVWPSGFSLPRRLWTNSEPVRDAVWRIRFDGSRLRPLSAAVEKSVQ
jgi:hypothetical protein